MLILHGHAVCSGAAVGRLRFYRHGRVSAQLRHVEDAGQEIERLRHALSRAEQELEDLAENAEEQEAAEIMELHRMMLADEDFRAAMEGRIREKGIAAENAVLEVSAEFESLFSTMDDEYMRARSADVRDVSARLVRILTGAVAGGLDTSVPVIVAADDLAPSETVQMDKSRILAFVTMFGSPNSHTAILSGILGVPAIVQLGTDLLPEFDGKLAAVDGDSGTLYIDPDEETVAMIRQKQEDSQRIRQELENFRTKESRTGSGISVRVCANISTPEDLRAAVENGAEGIGLFRSEFLYMESGQRPDEDRQAMIYRRVLKEMGGRRTVVRTIDLGADKGAEWLKLPHEENPALGCRGIRLCFSRPELLHEQLRALYRASPSGDLAILFPMVTSCGEVKRLREMARQVREELRMEEIPFREDVPLGVMIETPAAALISRDLAREADFFSIGTNDLIQYTLAADRQNPHVEQYWDPYHPAVRELIRITAQAAREAGIPAAVCGELAADPKLTEYFISLGIHELSVSPPQILPLRRHICSLP